MTIGRTAPRRVLAGIPSARAPRLLTRWCMWCSTCQQDVPALGSPSGGHLRCGKCSTPLASVTETGSNRSAIASARGLGTDASQTDNAALEKLLAGGPLASDDWAL